MTTPTGPPSYNLAALIPWLTRPDPIVAPLKKAAINNVYQAAARNLQRADSAIQAIVQAYYGIAILTDKASREPAINDFYKIGFAAWEKNTLALQTIAPHESIEAILGGYIVQAWTTFEVLAADLWEVALNEHPETLANIDSTKETGQDGKQIRLWKLREHGYDLRGKMGTLLREKFNFDSLQGIREAYAASFSIDNKKIEDALADKSADALNIMRQIIVHRAGVADQEYVNKASTVPLAPPTPVGSKIPLDGSTLMKIFSVAGPQATALITAVDDWIDKH
jgi:hypothetical protein